MYKIIQKITSLLTNRLFLTGFLIVLQLIWLILLMTALEQVAHWIDTIFIFISICVDLYIISRQGNPSYKILWLLFIGIFPLLGCLMYLIFGHGRPSRRMRACFKKGRESLNEPPSLTHPVEQLPCRPASLCTYLTNYSYPLYQNTQTQYYSLADKMFPQFIEDLNAAKHYIFMEYFIIADGIMWENVKTILKEKATAGLTVRFVYDDLGSVTCLPKKLREELTAAGVEVLSFNPFRPALSAVMNNRNHRKITVIDGYIGYTGGFNLADEYINQKLRFGHWKDTAIRLYGEGVFPLTQMCLEMWNAFHETKDKLSQYSPYRYHPDPFPSNGYLQPYCNSPFNHEEMARDVFIDLLAQAEHHAYIFTPYLAVDDTFHAALCTAAQRGVDVQIITPGIPDKRLVYAMTRSYYEPLIRAGVKIFEYSPGFLHAKNWVIDGKMGVVGTINLDYRALYLHIEDAILLYNNDNIAQMEEDFIQTRELSRRVTLEDCKNQPHNRLWHAFLRTISPFL